MNLPDFTSREDEMLQATDRMIAETKRIVAELKKSSAVTHRYAGQTWAEIAELRRVLHQYPAD
ncbi:MAG: hypothetical protein JWM88_1288 [Verrucomicrobia bacterium]|nr:hypothetical protein [Verrucomicrobiota bacterium]